MASSSKKSTSSGASERKNAAYSLKRAAPSKPIATPDPFLVEEVEVESSLEPVKRKEIMMTKELEPTPSKIALSDPFPSGSKDVRIPQTRVVLESEMTQALSESLSMAVLKGGSFDDIAREALCAAEKVI